MADKRREKRKISRTRIKFGDEGCDKTAFTSNFSQSGFFVRTNRVYHPGAILDFELEASKGQTFHVRGRVIHASRLPAQFARIRRCGMGVELLEESRDYFNLLKFLHIIEE